MRYPIVFFIFILASIVNTEAQNRYSKIFDLYGSTLDYGNSSDIIWNMVNSEDGLFLGMGNRCDDFSVDCSVVSKVNLEGDTLWTKLIDWLDPGIRALDKKGDTLLMAGHNTQTFENFYLYQMNLSGDSINTIEIFPPEDYYSLLISGIIQFKDYTIVYGSAKKNGESGQVSLVNWINNDGVLDTTIVIDEGDIYDLIYDVDVDSDGNLVLMNDKKDIVTGPNPYEVIRKNIIKFNTQKEKVWEWEESDTQFGVSGYIPSRIEALNNGKIIINADGGSDAKEEIWAIDENGIEWKYIFPPSNSLHRYITNISETSNGDIIGTGYVIDLTLPIDGKMAYLFRMSNEGEMLWEKAIVDTKNEVPDRAINSFMFDLIELNDGSILMGGRIDTWFYNNDNQETKGIDAWLIRTDANGCIIEDCEYVQDFTTSIPIFSDPIHIELYPNPASDFINISWPEEFPIREIQIYDPLGKLILRRLYPVENEQLDISGLSAGLYAVVLVDDRGRVYSEKVLVQ